MIVMGTALAVMPFNMLVDTVPKNAHQVLINMENTKTHGFDFVNGGPNRLFLKGKCDDTIWKLAKDLSWED